MFFFCLYDVSRQCKHGMNYVNIVYIYDDQPNDRKL